MSVTLEDDGDEEEFGRLPDGRPDPAYAAAVGLVPASPLKRSLAFVIDSVFVAVLSLPLTVGALPIWLGLALENGTPDPSRIIASSSFVSGIIFWAVGQGLVTLFTALQLILHGLRGVTIGKAIVGVRSVNVGSFRKPGFWRIVLRAVVFWAALAIVLLLGAVPFLLSPLWDPEKRGRGWLDRIGRNWLVDVRSGLDPFDTKALRHARKRVDAPARALEQDHPSLATDSSGAVTSFVPAARSSSGVIGAPALSQSAVAGWSTPVIDDAPAIGAPPAARSAAAPATQRDTVVVRHRQTVLVFDDGSTVQVERTGLLGRNPARQPGEEDYDLVPLNDPTSEISKTHASFGSDDGRFWICDRGSVNGTIAISPAGAVEELVPWRRTPLDDGSRVDLGGRSFRVTVADRDTKDIA